MTSRRLVSEEDYWTPKPGFPRGWFGPCGFTYKEIIELRPYVLMLCFIELDRREFMTTVEEALAELCAEGSVMRLGPDFYKANKVRFIISPD